jgi:hypothetical protein
MAANEELRFPALERTGLREVLAIGGNSTPSFTALQVLERECTDLRRVLAFDTPSQ